jgi:glyoxylase-like metal-dependent hydrolase (beta-lactamase superfamily II)
MLVVKTFLLGPVQTNTYLVADTETGDAVVIDPAWDGEVIIKKAEENQWQITSIWITHAHFDHIGGVNTVARETQEIYLHPLEEPLWLGQGGAALFGFQLDALPYPIKVLNDGQILQLGNYEFEVRHTPGHTPGHVVFYCSQKKIAFCGDVIFRESIGRTDLPGGSYEQLIQSVNTQLISLPDETKLLPGHGPQTTVGHERRYNPFIQVE